MSEILTPEQVEEIAEKANVLAQFAQNTGALEDYSCLVHNIPALIATIQAAWSDLKANASMLAKQCDLAREAETERDRIMKLLHDLTPTGSEFANSPERCAKWVQDSISSRTKLAIKAYAERNKAEAERDQARAEAAELRTTLECCVSECYTEGCANTDKAKLALSVTTLVAKHIEQDKAMERVCAEAKPIWHLMVGLTREGNELAEVDLAAFGELGEALEALKAVQGEQEGEGCEI